MKKKFPERNQPLGHLQTEQWINNMNKIEKNARMREWGRMSVNFVFHANGVYYRIHRKF
jgi:hypothetical protein